MQILANCTHTTLCAGNTKEEESLLHKDSNYSLSPQNMITSDGPDRYDRVELEIELMIFEQSSPRVQPVASGGPNLQSTQHGACKIGYLRI